jgi:hypothetical protein
MKESIPYIILLIFVIIIAFLPISNKEGKVTICIIDSVSNVNRYEISNDYDYRYHTDCDMILLSKKLYEIGDTIRINE